MTLTKPAAPDLLETPEWRIEGRDKVTGSARYAADITRPGMLHAAFVGSPYPHARVVSVDADAARVDADIAPFDDVRGSAAYKRDMARVWTERALTELVS